MRKAILLTAAMSSAVTLMAVWSLGAAGLQLGIVVVSAAVITNVAIPVVARAIG